MKAWVLAVRTLESSVELSQSVLVLNIISARSSQSTVASHLALLCDLFVNDLLSALQKTKYIKPVSDIKINTHNYGCMFWYSHPYVFTAQKAKILKVEKENDGEWLTWITDKYPLLELTDNGTPTIRAEEPARISKGKKIHINLYKAFT